MFANTFRADKSRRIGYQFRYGRESRMHREVRESAGPPWLLLVCGGQWRGTSLPTAAKSELPGTGPTISGYLKNLPKSAFIGGLTRGPTW